MLKIVDEGNKGTNQMSVSENENPDNTQKKLRDTAMKTQIIKVVKY